MIEGGLSARKPPSPHSSSQWGEDDFFSPTFIDVPQLDHVRFRHRPLPVRLEAEDYRTSRDLMVEQ